MLNSVGLWRSAAVMNFLNQCLCFWLVGGIDIIAAFLITSGLWRKRSPFDDGGVLEESLDISLRD